MKQFSAMALIMVLTLSTSSCSVDQTLSDIDLILQTANAVCQTIGAVAAGDATACQLVAGVGQAGIKVIEDDYNAWRASGATADLDKLQSAINVLSNNLPAELSAVHIKDEHAIATVSAWTNVVTSSLNVILSSIAQFKVARNKTERAGAINALPSPANLEARWRVEVCQNDTACGKLVKARHVHNSKILGVF